MFWADYTVGGAGRQRKGVLSPSVDAQRPSSHSPSEPGHLPDKPAPRETADAPGAGVPCASGAETARQIKGQARGLAELNGYRGFCESLEMRYPSGRLQRRRPSQSVGDALRQPPAHCMAMAQKGGV